MKKMVREYSGTRRLFQILSVCLALCLMLTTMSLQRIMADGPEKVSKDMLIPSSVVISEPTALSKISLPQSKYGSLAWENGSAVPSSYQSNYSVIFKSNGSVDLSGISGYDTGSGTLKGTVTVVVKSLAPASTGTPTPEVTQTETPTPDADKSEEDSKNNSEEDSKDGKDDADKPEEPSKDEESEDTDQKEESSDQKEDVSEDGEKSEDEDTQDEDTQDEDTQDEDTQKEDKEDVDKDNASDDTVSSEDKDSVKDDTDQAEKEDSEDTQKEEETEKPDADKDADKEDSQEKPSDSENTEDEDSKEENADSGDEDSDTGINDITADELEEAVSEQPQTADPEAVPQDQAQAAAKNHTCGGISVSADFLPWYVQFRASSTDSYEFSNEDEANIFQSYEFELWDLLEDKPYEIPAGKYVTVTVPVKEGYEYTIEHLLDNGGSETIIPTVYGSTMIFSVDSFSPFGIAGSKPLVGDEIAAGGYSEATPTPTPTSRPSSSSSAVKSDSNVNSSNSNRTQTSGSDNSTDRSSYFGSTSSNSSSVERTVTYQNKTVKAVQTGDTTEIMSFIIMAVVGLVVVAAIIIIILVLNNKRRK